VAEQQWSGWWWKAAQRVQLPIATGEVKENDMSIGIWNLRDKDN
jgi:hypothetical protein